MLNRRDVLKIAALAPVGAAIGHRLLRNVASAEKLPEIKTYKLLGKTGQKISDLSLGGGGLSGPLVVQRALEMGITYIDTAPDYGQSEKIIGMGWKKSGVARDRLSTSFATGWPVSRERCVAISADWLKPRLQMRQRWSGTGTSRAGSGGTWRAIAFAASSAKPVRRPCLKRSTTLRARSP